MQEKTVAVFRNSLFFVEFIHVQNEFQSAPVEGRLPSPLLCVFLNKGGVETLPKIKVLPACKAIGMFNDSISSVV